MRAPETRDKIAAAQRGDKGRNWRGGDVGYSGIHERARALLPDECLYSDATCKGHLEVCLKADAAGPFRDDKRGRYSATVADYIRLCRSHHNRYDGKEPPPETRVGRALART